MKQHITPEDLATLSPEQKEKLREWWKPKFGNMFIATYPTGLESDEEFVAHTTGRKKCWIHTINEQRIGVKPYNKADCLPLLSTGQCLELLDYRLIAIENSCSGWGVALITPKCDEWKIIKEELINALFEAVKAIL